MKKGNTVQNQKPAYWVACLLSAGLLILSFPRFDFWPLAWAGLIPLMFALDGKSPKRAFFIAYLAGVIFFAGTLYWIGHVTVAGTIILVLYCALYWGAFGAWYAWVNKEQALYKLLLLPSGWTALEYLRSELLSGFSWMSLCLSQYKNLAIIQVSDIAGMFFVTFLIVAVNVAIKEILGSFLTRENKNNHKQAWQAFGICSVVLVTAIIYGMNRLATPFGEKKLLVSVIQANISQEQKWDERYWPEVVSKYRDLTLESLRRVKPSLVVWPETAFPGIIDINQVSGITPMDYFVTEAQIRLLYGTVTQLDNDYFNSAILFFPDFKPMRRYDKIHLVPFGEYIPFREQLPFLGDLIPITDFSGGVNFNIFDYVSSDGKEDYKFSAMICFEDTIPKISKRFADQGAEFLVNITNDAWFKDSVEPFMHLQSAVFRAVENRRYLVRAANTGISVFINPHGRMEKKVENEDGKMTFVEGFIKQNIFLNNKKSIYTKYGDFFTLLYFGCILMFIKIKKS